MSGWFAASLTFRRTALTVCLCVMTFLFAVEAKTARYGPVAGPGSNVRAAKAFPASAPRLVEHGVPTPDPTQPQVISAKISASAVAIFLAREVSARGSLLREHSPHFSAAHLTPACFFRPPPVC